MICTFWHTAPWMVCSNCALHAPYCCVIVAGQGRLTVSLLAPMVSQFFWHRCRFQIGYRHVTNMRLFRHYPAPPPQVAHLCLLACVSVGLCVFVCLGACACACACACVCACVCAFVGAILRPYGLPFPPAPLPVPDWIPACDSRRGIGRERYRERERMRKGERERERARESEREREGQRERERGRESERERERGPCADLQGL